MQAHNRIVATITPPTPNGDLHLGHMAGPFLSADIFTRTRRLLGDEVLLVSYSDDYQSYLARKAMEQKIAVSGLAHTNAKKINETLLMANIRLDHFMESWQNPSFIQAVRMFYEHAKAKGAIYSKQVNVPYCEQCQTYGYEALVRGACDHCGHASDPSQCECCAHYPDVEKMQDLKCTLCHGEIAWRKVTCEVLSLNHYRGTLWKIYSSVHAHFPLRQPLYDFLESVLAGTEDNPELEWIITRPHETGIDIYGDQTTLLHTWFSGMSGYYAATEEYAVQNKQPFLLEHFWHDPQTKLVQFLGLDCAYSHAIAYRSFLTNFEKFPQQVYLYSNAFLKLNGGDFSTSRGHAIWIRDILEKVSADCLRFYLSLFSPEISPRNFEEVAFGAWRKKYELRYAAFIQTASHLSQTEGRVSPHLFSASILAEIQPYIDKWLEAAKLEQFSAAQLAAVLDQFADFLYEKIGQSASIHPTVLAFYAVLGQPIHPVFSQSLLDVMECDATLMVTQLRDYLLNDLQGPSTFKEQQCVAA